MSNLGFALLSFVFMCFELKLRKELFLAVLTLKHLLHMDEHVLFEGLPVDKQLAAVVAEHTRIE